MLKLLIEKKTLLCYKSLSETLEKALRRFDFIRHEDDNCIMLICGFVPKEASNLRKRRYFSSLIKTVSTTVSLYAVLTMPNVWVTEYVTSRIKQEQLFTERKSIAETVNGNVMRDIKKELRRRKRRNWLTVISERALQNISQCSVFAVSSFIAFCTQDYKRYVQIRAKSAFCGIQEELKYIETIELLRGLAEKRNPRIESVYLTVRKNEYQISDSSGEPLNDEIMREMEKEGTDREDLLIGVLIALSPNKIVVLAENGFYKTNFFSTLANVFGNRLCVEYARNEK